MLRFSEVSRVFFERVDMCSLRKRSAYICDAKVTVTWLANVSLSTWEKILYVINVSKASLVKLMSLSAGTANYTDINSHLPLERIFAID